MQTQRRSVMGDHHHNHSKVITKRHHHHRANSNRSPPATKMDANNLVSTKNHGGKLKGSLARLHNSEPFLTKEKSVKSLKSVRSAQSISLEKELLLSSLSSLTEIYHGENKADSIAAEKESLLASMSSLSDLLAEEEDETDQERRSFNALVASVQSLVSFEDRLDPDSPSLGVRKLHESSRTMSDSTEDSSLHGSLAEVAEAVSALLLSRHTFTVQEETSLELELNSLKKLRKKANTSDCSPEASFSALKQLPLIPESPVSADESTDHATDSKMANKGRLDAFLNGETVRKRAEHYNKQKDKVVTIVTSSRKSTTSQPRDLPLKSAKVHKRERQREELSPITVDSFTSSESSPRQKQGTMNAVHGIRLPFPENHSAHSLRAHFRRTEDTAPKKPSRSKD